MRLIITGGLGHIGSGFLSKIGLLQNLRKIIVIDNDLENKKHVLFKLKLKTQIEFIESNILSMNLAKIINDGDIIIHFAAITNAADSFNIKNKLIKNNFLSTKKLVDLSKKKKINYIFFSSTSVYGSNHKKMLEDDTKNLNPQSPYAECKIREEKYIQSTSKKNKMNFVILRLGTIYGASPGMRFHTAVNKFCYQASLNKPLTIWKTALNQKRPYLDLNDAIRCIKLIIAKNLFYNDIYNVITNNITLKDLITIIKKYKKIKIKKVSNKIMNQLSYEVSDKKINELGFKPKGNIGLQIKKTLLLFNGLNL